MAVGVLDGGLRLADSTQSADGLGAPAGKAVFQSLEIRVPTSEERIARRQVPVEIIGLALLRRQRGLSHTRLARKVKAQILVALLGVERKMVVSLDLERNVLAVGIREQHGKELLVDPASVI